MFPTARWRSRRCAAPPAESSATSFRSPAAALALALVCSVGCRPALSAPTSSSNPPPSATDEERSVGELVRPGKQEPALDPELERLWLQVARARGLEAGRTPRLVTLPQGDLARRALVDFEREMPEPALRAQTLLLARLRLVPPDFALLPALQAALESRLQAFYSAAPDAVTALPGMPTAQLPTLFVGSALSGATRRAALAHELVHALQDHWHALSRRLEYEPDSWDRKSALHALAEADALALVERLGLAEDAADSARSDEPAPEIPGVIACSLAAPYLDARARVAALLQQGGFGAVDAELRQPPSSTHELLHGAGSPQRVLEPLPAPAPDWQRGYSDVLGEQSLRCVLEQWGAPELAASWAGDRLSSFERGGATALAWELRLAQPEAARAIFQRLRSALGLPPGRRGRRVTEPVTDWSCGALGDSGVVAVTLDQSGVGFASLSGVPDRGGCASLETWLESAPLGSLDLGPLNLTGRPAPRQAAVPGCGRVSRPCTESGRFPPELGPVKSSSAGRKTSK